MTYNNKPMSKGFGAHMPTTTPNVNPFSQFFSPFCSTSPAHFPTACISPPPVEATVSEAFQLSTERRAKERQGFERAAMEKEALRARMEEQQRLLEEERTKEEVAKMRQEQVKEDVIP